MSDMQKVTGLWKSKTKGGQHMLSGKINDRAMEPIERVTNGSRIIILENKFKETERHPDYNLFIAPPDDEQQQQQPQPKKDDFGDVPF